MLNLLHLIVHNKKQLKTIILNVLSTMNQQKNESYNLGCFKYDKKQGAWVYWSKGYLGEETGTTYEASLDDSQEELIDDFSDADDESWQYMLKWNNQ